VERTRGAADRYQLSMILINCLSFFSFFHPISQINQNHPFHWN
jgi:hypothetical protein